MKPPKETPWGVADSMRELTPGSKLWRVGTPGHGGIFVPDDLLEKLPEAHQQNWFEEDEAWSIPACVFAEELDGYTVWSAWKTLQSSFPELAKLDQMGFAEGKAGAWEMEHQNHYLAGGSIFNGATRVDVQWFDPLDKKKPRFSLTRQLRIGIGIEEWRVPSVATAEELLALGAVPA